MRGPRHSHAGLGSGVLRTAHARVRRTPERATAARSWDPGACATFFRPLTRAEKRYRTIPPARAGGYVLLRAARAGLCTEEAGACTGTREGAGGTLHGGGRSLHRHTRWRGRDTKSRPSKPARVGYPRADARLRGIVRSARADDGAGISGWSYVGRRHRAG